LDNLLLTSVVASLAERLADVTLEDVRQESGHRFRLCWRVQSGDESRFTVLSLAPESPWIGELLHRPSRKRAATGTLAATLRRLLDGKRLASVSKPTIDRWVQFLFTSGEQLIVELAVHGANLVLIDAEGRLVESLRRPKRAAARLSPGEPWRPPSLPAAAIERLEAELASERDAVGELLESSAGSFDSSRPVSVLVATIFDDEERQKFGDDRRRGLLQILKRERRRLSQALTKAQRDRENFKDPERYQRWAIALLAGLSQSRRLANGIQVPDPEAHDGADLIVPAEPGVAPAKVAERLFNRHRRALRGQQRAAERAQQLAAQLQRVEEIFAAEELSPSPERELEASMRAAGLAVGLRHEGRAARIDRHRRLPRLEGVRVYTATSGETILAGKGGKENHRLTFRLASPDDFWFHALGLPGAHVILRNPERQKSPSRDSLLEAASVAAFHSDASGEEWVDVQWTIRKNVKKPRQAAMGTVVLKRFETLRVRPGLP